MVTLSKRLQTIASFVPKNSFFIDVGCDHAYLPIYLCQNKICSKAIASDIRIEPLNFARKNIQKYHLEDNIIILNQDGIKNINPDIDTIVISGMGGLSINKILENKSELKNIRYLVLSPNNEFIKVRKKIYQLGFIIEKETIVIDKNIAYLVIRAIPGKGKCNSLFGILDKNDLNTIYFYTKLLHDNTNILKKLPIKYFRKRLDLLIQNRKIKKFLAGN